MPDADCLELDAPETPKEYGVISRHPARLKAILALLDAGKTQQEIADVFHVSQMTISRIAREWTPVVELAERRTKALAVKAVDSLERAFEGAEKLGKHGPQATVLQVAGLLKKEDDGPKVVVQIGIASTSIQGLSGRADG